MPQEVLFLLEEKQTFWLQCTLLVLVILTIAFLLTPIEEEMQSSATLYLLSLQYASGTISLQSAANTLSE